MSLNDSLQSDECFGLNLSVADGPNEEHDRVRVRVQDTGQNGSQVLVQVRESDTAPRREQAWAKLLGKNTRQDQGSRKVNKAKRNPPTRGHNTTRVSVPFSLNAAVETSWLEIAVRL